MDASKVREQLVDAFTRSISGRQSGNVKVNGEDIVEKLEQFIEAKVLAFALKDA